MTTPENTPSSQPVTADELNRQLAAFRSSHSIQTLVHNGAQWQYYHCGSGAETLVFLPGATGLAEAYFPFLTAFEDRFSVLAPAYPAVKTMNELADGVAAIIAHEGCARLHIFGQSFGGLLAQLLARRLPDQTLSLILSHSSTSCPPVPEDLNFKARREMMAFLGGPAKLPYFILRPRFVASLLYGLELYRPHEFAFWKKFFTELLAHTPKERLIASYECTLDFHKNVHFNETDLVDWNGRVLVVQSENDDSHPAEEKAALATLYPNATLHTFPGAGRQALITRREDLIQLLRNFLLPETA